MQIIAELLYLNYESQDRPIYMYINSPGISAPDGRAIGFDTEAFAIADVMSYIRAPVATVCVGQCYGSAAMLLAWCVWGLHGVGSEGNQKSFFVIAVLKSRLIDS